MSICDGCIYKPKSFSYCHKSETIITSRYCICSSFSKDGLTEKERAVEAYRKAKGDETQKTNSFTEEETEEYPFGNS